MDGHPKRVNIRVGSVNVWSVSHIPLRDFLRINLPTLKLNEQYLLHFLSEDGQIVCYELSKLGLRSIRMLCEQAKLK